MIYTYIYDWCDVTKVEDVQEEGAREINHAYLILGHARCSESSGWHVVSFITRVTVRSYANHHVLSQ